MSPSAVALVIGWLAPHTNAGSFSLRQERMPRIRMATTDGLSVYGAGETRRAGWLTPNHLARCSPKRLAPPPLRRLCGGRSALERELELAELVIAARISRPMMLPPAWSQESGSIGLRALVAEIGKLLLELTGNVVIRRLEQIPELHASGLVWRAQETN